MYRFCLLTLTLITNLTCTNSTGVPASGIDVASQTFKKHYPKLQQQAKTAFNFCSAQKLNTSFCILIDMGIHSGLRRFFMWDFTKDTITMAIPVSHGCCDADWNSDDTRENPRFSNIDGSHCTSLGKYRLGKRGYSNWGINVNYLMHGLESGNKNALARQIVFHSWDNVTDDEVYPDGTVEGWGCPAISNNNMRIIDAKLQREEKPVLMWIYR